MNDTSPEKLAALYEVRDMFPGTSAQAQCCRVREFVERGHMLNTFEASRYLDVYHCPARVLQLRTEGLNIVTLWVRVTTEAGETHRVGNYMLMRGVEHAAA